MWNILVCCRIVVRVFFSLPLSLLEVGIIRCIADDFSPHINLTVFYRNKWIGLGEELSLDVQRLPDCFDYSVNSERSRNGTEHLGTYCSVWSSKTDEKNRKLSSESKNKALLFDLFTVGIVTTFLWGATLILSIYDVYEELNGFSMWQSDVAVVSKSAFTCYNVWINVFVLWTLQIEGVATISRA